MVRYWPWLTGLLLVALIGTVGCMKGNDPSSLKLWLEMPSEVRAGETVPLKLKIKNTSNRLIILGHARPAYDFLVTKPDGTWVWRWAPVILDILLGTLLNPREELEFTAEWDQRELKVDFESGSIPEKGDPVPPGTYWVQGIFNGNIYEKMYEGGAEYLKTKPKRLIILPSQ